MISYLLKSWLMDGILPEIRADIYSPSPEMRDKFRCVKAHNTIQIYGDEQNIFNGMFNIKKEHTQS